MRGRERSPVAPANSKAVFVAGTDTGVGKTIAAAAILSVLRDGGIDAVPMKPVQTGCATRRRSLVAPDLEFCLTAAGLEPAPADKKLMAPCMFTHACSPHLAARLERRTIDPGVVARSFSNLSARHEFVVIEGAGGLLVPIGSGRTMLDVIRRLAAPVVLVARPGLGTINHCLLSLQALRQAGIAVAGVIFNHSQPGKPGYIERDNVAAVASLGHVRILGSLPFVPHLSKLSRSPAAFAKWATSHLEPALPTVNGTGIKGLQ